MGDIENTTQDIYQDGIKQGWQHFDADELDEAERISRDLINQYPTKSGCHFLLGHIHRLREQFQSAADEFLIALANDPDGDNNGYIYYWLAVVYGLKDWIDNDPAYIYDERKSEEYYKAARNCQYFPPQVLYHFEHSLKGQDKIDLMEDGITRFPDMPQFYILLAEHYGYQGMSKMQLASLQRAVDRGLTSISLQYNLGLIFLKERKYQVAKSHFEQALAACSQPYDFAINYYLGRVHELMNEPSLAEQNYLEVYQNETGNQDILFGLFGLVTIYVDNGQRNKLDELILNLKIDKDLIFDSGRVTGGPVRLDDHVIDSISIENFTEVYQKLSKLKLDPATPLLNGKIWLLRYFLAAQLQKYSEQYKAVKGALKCLNTYHYEFVHELHAEALSQLLYYKSETTSDRESFHNLVVKDLAEDLGFKKHFIIYSEDLFKLFFDAGNYDKVVKLSEFFTVTQLSEHDLLFKTAYSYAELNENAKAESLYNYYLAQHGDNTAVLNNLANLLDEKGDYSGAVALYQRGLKIDATHKNLNDNLRTTSKKLALAEEKAAKEKSLQQEYMAAVHALKSENDFVIEKLALFIDRIKTDSSFDNWRLPVPKHNFPKYLAVNKQIADSLLTQWLKKQYLVDTKDRDNFNVVIYAVNPYLEAEIKRIQKLKIPKAWIDSFMNISAETLDEKSYFTLMERIEKMNKKFKPIFHRDVDELFYNYFLGHEKATIVLSGSLVELALIFYCEKKKVKTILVQDGNKVKSKQLYSCVLNELIAYVEQIKAFGQDFTYLSNLSRIYRNFVHPGRELKDSLDKSKSDLCFISTVEILKKIL